MLSVKEKDAIWRTYCARNGDFDAALISDRDKIATKKFSFAYVFPVADSFP